MKKMLTTIGAFGLVATTGNTLVACSWFDKYEKNANAFLQLNTYEIHLAKKTNERIETEVLEILDHNKKTEQFKKVAEDHLKDLNNESPLELQIEVSVKLYHISGITNLTPYHEETGKYSHLVRFESAETRGKSTWLLTLIAKASYVINKVKIKHDIANLIKPVYFDVIID